MCIRDRIRAVIVDPAAASFIAELRKRGYRVLKADNDVEMCGDVYKRQAGMRDSSGKEVDVKESKRRFPALEFGKERRR